MSERGSIRSLWRIQALVLIAATLIVAPAHAAPMDEVDAVVREAMAKGNAPGVAVAIIAKGEVVAAKGYGLANVELDVPVSERTVFQSGSVGKQFTAAAVMLQVEDGKLKLDDPIVKYFKGAPRSWRTITVRHLLTHTSGIPDYTTLDLRRDYSESELAKFAYGLKLEFGPGARFNYSNTGYVLLGILVHKVSGRFYGDVLAERVFAPLGMKTARVISEADIVPNRASGYRLADGKLKNQEWVSPTLNTTADGSLYLTLADMIAWDRGLRAKAILTPESWAQVFTPVRLKSGKTYPYGFGWDVETVNGQTVHRHSGSWQGFKSYIARYLGSDLAVIVLANQSAFDPGALVAEIAAKVDPALVLPELKPIADNEPAVTARLKGLLAMSGHGKLKEKSLKYVRAGTLPNDGYASLVKPLGALQRLDLLERKELGDDRVYLYDAVYAAQTLRVRLGLAPDDGVSELDIRRK